MTHIEIRLYYIRELELGQTNRVHKHLSTVFESVKKYTAKKESDPMKLEKGFGF